MSFLRLVVVVLACLLPFALAADSATTSATAFNFHDYLLGEWDVLKTDAIFSPPSFDFSPFRGRYVFEKENGTSSVVGRYYDNHTETGEVENQLSVHIDFDDTANGQWKTGKDVDSLTPLFAFSFVLHPAGHPTTVGEWHGAEDAFYLLQINAPDKFTITVTPKALQAQGGEGGEADDAAVTIYSLKKKPEAVAKTFFQQYGTYLMLAVFFVVNMYDHTNTAHPTCSQPMTALLTSPCPLGAVRFQVRQVEDCGLHCRRCRRRPCALLRRRRVEEEQVRRSDGDGDSAAD